MSLIYVSERLRMIIVSRFELFFWCLLLSCIPYISGDIYHSEENEKHSMKNIPIPPKERYLKSMMEKVERFIARLKWKAHFFLIKRNIR